MQQLWWCSCTLLLQHRCHRCICCSVAGERVLVCVSVCGCCCCCYWFCRLLSYRFSTFFHIFPQYPRATHCSNGASLLPRLPPAAAALSALFANSWPNSRAAATKRGAGEGSRCGGGGDNHPEKLCNRPRWFISFKWLRNGSSNSFTNSGSGGRWRWKCNVICCNCCCSESCMFSGRASRRYLPFLGIAIWTLLLANFWGRGSSLSLVLADLNLATPNA